MASLKTIVSSSDIGPPNKSIKVGHEFSNPCFIWSSSFRLEASSNRLGRLRAADMSAVLLVKGNGEKGKLETRYVREIV